ncbi:hypothetical protein, variant [Phytophthora nicotianae INRA-310]|uniref:histidine kinase n=1 Tax=Phytophthora nicotianae (strain INRA-310) TaxID=761204 RepID=W2QI01_PHYN3|nr:hypothetical protein, variant [Phytophthora nicotianae INRA-310]ETN12516.1 hypothetical protein, variant [Phytophthora nicotianae INRA-310]
MGKHKKPRPQRAVAGPSPAPSLDNNAAETQQQDVVEVKQQKVASQSFGSQVEALAQLLLDANAPAVGVDVSGCVTVWNKRLADITGFQAERVLGRPISDFVYGAQRKSEITAVVAACVADKRPVLELRVPLLTTTGRNAEVLTNMTPLLAEDGTCVGVYGVGQDVTEWAIQEKQYATVMMQANAPIIELDKEGNITVWNTKTESMTGYSSVDMLGEPLLPVVDKSFRKIVSEKIEQALSGIPGTDFELPLVTARGSRVEIVLCLTPRFDTLGSVMGVVAIGQDVTERNTKEMEYRKLIETANAPIFGVDTEGRVVIFNAKAAQISEYAPEEVMGVDLVDTLISEKFRSEVAAVFQRAFQGIETANFEFPLVTKTGRKVELLLNATPRYDHTGHLVGVVGIGQDITDRIIQEKEYSRLIDTANAPIFGVDCNGEVIIWNKKAAAITDYTNEDTIGQKIFKFISEDYRDAVGKVLSKALEGEGTANFDFPLITKSGRRLDILLNATPKYDHFGNICGAVGIGQDITDRRAQEQEYTRLIDTANAPIFGVDENGCVNIWNRKAAGTTQYSNEEVLGVNLVENFIPEDFREAVWAVLSAALKGQETANFEFPLNTKDGRRVEILLNATPRYNEKGVVMGVVGIGQDITIRMAQEKETNRLIHSANAPIFGVDQDGRVNIWNLKVAEITQFSSREIMGKDLVNLFVAEDHRESVGLLLRKALQGEQTGNFDFPIITKTGRRVEILLNATPRYDELGQIFGVMGIGQDITERIAQEQEYIRLIDTANAPIFGVDSDGRVNIWNKKAAEIMQYTTDAVMGEKLVEKYITKDYQEAVSNVLSEALNGVETANFEFPLITKAGRRVEILLNATPRYNEHGAVIGMVGIGQDITDRIAQEQEYLRLIDTANAPIFGVDINGRVNIWNRKAAEITQYTNAEVLGKDLVAEFISEEYKVPVRSVLEKAFEDVETANFEFPLITKAGRRVEILLNATPRYNEQGEVMGMVGIGQDITVRMAQEKEKNRMIHSANAPIFGVDQDGLVNIWNLKVAEITQFSSEEVMGQDLVNRFVAEDHRDEVNFNLRKALEGKPTGNFDFPLITKTGRRVEILLNATPRYDELGQIFGVTGIGQDITERIAQEQEYIRLIDTANAPIFGVDSDGRHGAVIGMVGIGQDITDRIAQEQEYTRLIDTANAPIFGVDINGRVNIWNRKAADIMQYTNEDVLGKDLVAEFISNEYKVPVRSVLEKAFEGIETANFEFPLITKAGRRVEILLNATPRYNERGEVMGMVGIGQDITERIAQEEEYSRLIDTANAPIFGVDINGHVNIWNRKAADIMQYTNEDVLGKDLVAEFISNEYKVPVRSVLEKAFEGVETANFEFPLITRAGRRVEILLNATPRYNERGEVMGMVGIGQDITERIAQEQEHSRMIDTANAPIFGVDTDGRVNIWNRKAADIMQYTNEDVLGKNLVEQFISEEYRVAVRSVLEKAFEGVETANFEFPLITRAGRRVEILLNATPRYNERGEVMGMVGIGQDITERIAQEQEYSRLIDTANAPIFGVDINGHVNIWNRKAADIMQYTNEDVLGKDLVAEFISNEYKVPILLNATPRYNEHGEVKGMVGIGQDITERIAQEQEYSRLIDTANAPIFGVDINGHVNIWNRKAADIMQYTNEDVLGKDLVAEFISNEYKIPVRSVLEKAFEGIETANFEFPLITKAGRRVEILLNATPRYNERGEVMGMVGIGQDITDRIAQEQEYTRLIDSANAPIFGVDVNGCVNIWNKKAAEITQYTPNDVMGENLVEKFITEDYREAVGRVLSKALDGVETANFEFPLMTKAGRRVEILLNATSRFNEHGEVIGMVGIGQDITERIAQEQEYTRLIDTANAPIFGVDINGQDITERIAQEQEYTRLIDTANAPIFGVDINGRVNIWNRKAAETTQYMNAEVLGKDLVAEFISKEYKVPVRSVLEKAFEGVETANFEFPLITKAGRRVEILLNATPRYNEHGEVMGMVGIGQDITERIAQEQEYTRLIDTANAPIFGVDINGHVNIWNRKAADIMQYTNEDVLGKDLVAEFISNEYKVPVRSVLEKAFEGIETANFEFPLITKAGRRVEILLNATPRYNERGEVMGMVGIGQDITERIAQEQEYSRLIDTANAPIFGVDINGRVNIWNRKAAHIMQYTNEDVLGKDLVAEFISEEYKIPVRSVLEKAFEGVETANFEFPLITKAGRRVEILLNATPRYNEHGEVKGMVANFEFPLITKAGRRVEILLNATPRYNERGEVMGMVGIGQDITERIAQEEEYSRLIDTANAPIFGVDINGRVNIWNRKAADIMQYTNEDVLGKDLVAEFISNEYKVPVRSVLEKAFEGIETANFEFPLITRAGRRVEILLNATPRYNERGEVMGMVGIGQDITERIAQEQEYSRLIDTANAPIFGVDTNMRINIFNRKAQQITNFTSEEVVGEMYVETIISEEFKAVTYDIMCKALQGNETASFELALTTKTGRKVNILLNATARFDQHGQIVGVVGIGQDITDRIAQEQEYTRLIDSANAPIFGVDVNGCVNIWNKKAAEITQYTPMDVMGENLVEKFITEDYRKAVGLVFSKACEGTETANFEFPLMTKAGRRLEILLNATSRFNEHGEVMGVDYTARKHMEAAKVNFLASFSHELRTPLNGVLGMLELLKEQPLDKSIERYVHMAYVSGSLLLNLINDILDLSKIEAGHLEISTAPFQMHDLLDYSIEIFKFKAKERGLKLELKCGDNVPKAVIGDVVRLRQVLLNLLSNAIKFTNEGSITVACSVVHSPELPPQFKKLLFQVIDTGIGMDAEEKMRLFSLFTKLERTRQNNPTGSGLGLAICKQLAELMDGSIDVDSELGVGSNFFFTVVVRLIDEVDPKHAYYSSEDFLDPSTALLSPNGGVRAGENGENATVRAEVPKQARILVVEDNEFNWEVVKCFLQQDDHLLQWEVNGRDAVKAYSENHTEFDLVFMDCEMPIMDGYTATNAIREFELKHNLPRIPILGLTAYAMSGDRQKCLDCGMDEFMVKPISKLSLRKAIRQWMRIRYLGQHNAALGAVVQAPGATGQPVTLRNGPRPTAKSPMRIPAPSPGAPTPMPSFDSDLEDVTLMDAVSTARLAPASRHMQQLDLAQAISNLELDDPMSIGLQSGRAVRTATPTTSIFSLGPSVNNTARQTSTNDLPDVLRLSRNTSGASTASPPEPEKPTETSTTLPYTKTPFTGVTNSPFQHGSRSPLTTNPTLWSHPPFNTKDLPTGRPQSWSGLAPKKKVSFHEELESSHPSRTGLSSIGSSMPSVLERMETGSSVEDDTPVEDTITPAQGEAAVSHSIDPMSIEIPEGDPVNYSLGVDQCGGHEELFLTLLEKFATTSEAITNRVMEAHERNDFVTARREAHSLKGSSAYVAALRVSKCAFRVQVAYEHLMAQQATGEGSDTLAAKQIVDDSVRLLRKEQKLLRGYLRRNFEFKTQAGPSQVTSGHQPDEDKPNGPCCVM